MTFEEFSQTHEAGLVLRNAVHSAASAGMSHLATCLDGGLQPLVGNEVHTGDEAILVSFLQQMDLVFPPHALAVEYHLKRLPSPDTNVEAFRVCQWTYRYVAEKTIDVWEKEPGAHVGRVRYAAQDMLPRRLFDYAYNLPERVILEEMKKVRAQRKRAKEKEAKVRSPAYEETRAYVAQLRRDLAQIRRQEKAIEKTDTFRKIGGIAKIGLGRLGKEKSLAKALEELRKMEEK